MSTRRSDPCCEGAVLENGDHHKPRRCTRKVHTAPSFVFEAATPSHLSNEAVPGSTSAAAVREAFRQDRLDLFWWFVCERQSIWNKRFVLRSPPPWTSDRILRSTRFTNVYRELDPGTRYALDEILEKDVPRPDKVFNVMLYRLIGRSETHAWIGFQRLDEFDATDLECRLKHLRDAMHKPVFTGAYLVSGYSGMGSKDKVENVCRLFEHLCDEFDWFYGRLMSAKQASEAYHAIRSMAGFGNFLAYQVLVDLLYPIRVYDNTPLLHLSSEHWAAAGPGAKKGIQMLFHGSERVAPLRIMLWLRDHQASEFARLGLDFPYLKDDQAQSIPLSLPNIQNCLCEFHKYIKIHEGTGRGRRQFRPRTGRSTEQLLHYS